MVKPATTIRYLREKVLKRIDQHPWGDGTLLDHNGCMCLIGYLGVKETHGDYIAPTATVEAAVVAVAKEIKEMHPQWIHPDNSSIYNCWNYNDREIIKAKDPREECRKLVKKAIDSLRESQ